MRRVRAVAMLLGLLVLSGCSTMQKVDTDAYTPVVPNIPTPEYRGGSIYHEATSLSLYEDIKARRVGDMVTVVLTEQTRGTKTASTTASKTTDVSITAPTVLGQSLTFNSPFNDNTDLGLGAEISSSSDFEGEGDSALSNSLNGRITVMVTEVLPNGYLVVRGQKRLTINQGNEYVQLAGILRPHDIRPDNTIPSTLIGDAKITYTGDGPVGESNAMGGLARFFHSMWPF